MDAERTHITDMKGNPDARPVDAEPCLILRGGGLPERVIFLEDGAAPMVLGRGAAADVPVEDADVSRGHLCAWRKGDRVTVRDTGSTNGTWLRGARLTADHVLEAGQFLHLGRHTLALGWRNRAITAQAREVAQDLEKASRYVLSLLPDRVSEGPVALDWAFEPSLKLGGDVFGYHAIDSRFLAGYLIDVSGHGAGAAMHSTSILAALRNQTLPGVDFTDPGAVLGALNAAFDMDQHDGYTFTIWYGAYDLRTRRLAFSSGGHHPAYLVSPAGGAAMPLRTRNPLMGAMPGARFASAQIDVVPGSRLHIFSDGCFEITDMSGTMWGLSDFLPLLTGLPEGVNVSAQALFEAVRGAAQPGPLADDFSIMSVCFR